MITVIFGLFLIYAFIAMGYVIYSRNSLKTQAVGYITNNVDPLSFNAQLTPHSLERYGNGKSVPQMFSFVLSVLIVLGSVIAVLSFLALYIISSWQENHIGGPYGMDEITSLSTIALIAYFASLIILAPLTVIVNAFWLYSRKITFVEEHSLLSSKNKFVKIQRVFAWVSWSAPLFIILLLFIWEVVSNGIGLDSVTPFFS